MDFDTDLWSEIADAHGEIWDMDIPELNEDYPSSEESFNSFLASNWDF